MEDNAQISSLRLMVEKVEKDLGEMKLSLSKITQGIFGDAELHVMGLLKRQELQQSQLNRLEAEIEKLKDVNIKEDVKADTIKVATDGFIVWVKRIFWVVITMLGTIALITGKIGILEIINLAK